MRRRDFFTFVGGTAAAWPLAVGAQQQAMPVVGFLHGGSSAPYARQVAAFRQGLTEVGYVEGRNVMVEYRWADDHPDRLPALATDLVAHHVKVIAAATLPAAPAAKAATAMIPIVFLIGGDPVELGLVATMSRPGGNMTGIAVLNVVLAAKRLEVLHELVPTVTVIAMLLHPTSPYTEPETRELEAAARTSGQRLLPIKAKNRDEIDAAFSTLVRERARALIVSADPFFTSHRNQLVMLAAQHGLPAIYQWRDFVDAGGLISYGTSHTDIYRQTGKYVGQILKGAKPADLPVQQPTKFELVINLKTAKALGLTVPPTLLARADEVIE
jgi:putative ABC transport system substrate-binding protein